MATPSGNHSIVREALDEHLNSIVYDPRPEIAQEAKLFKPTVQVYYLQPSYMPNRSDFGDVGGKLRRMQGLYQVLVKGPPNKGPLPLTELADAVIELFSGQNLIRNNRVIRIGTFDGTSAGVPYASPELVADGWRTIPITIPWWCDVYK